MTRACIAAVHAATGNVFSDQEADDLVNRLTQKALRARQDAPTLTEREAVAEAAKALTREQLMAALTEQRLRVASEAATALRRSRLDAMPAKMGGAEKLNAYNVGSEKQGVGVSSSVDAEARARQMTLWGKVQIGLDKTPGLMDRITNFWGFSEKSIDRKIAAEMARINGDGSVEPTGDEGALHAARVLASALEEARESQNALGAWIDKREGYIVRQSHDADKVSGGLWRQIGEYARRVQANGRDAVVDWAGARLAAERRAFGEWRDVITPLLDDKTFAGLTSADMDPDMVARGQGLLKDPSDPREQMLHHIWMDIVTGRHEELSGAGDDADFRPKPSLARSVSKGRVLQFKSPDAWMDYNVKYGRGGLFKTVMGQLDRAGRNAALMRMWGPSPEAAFEAERTRLQGEARQRGDAGAVKDLDATKVKANFETVNGRGDTPENMRLAQTMRTLRGIEGLCKLGSIVLSKATDLPMSGHTMARAGAGFLAGYEGFFKGITRLGSQDAKHAADALDVGARAFAGHMGGQFVTGDGAPGWVAWATRLQYKLNLFEAFNEAIRSGGAQVYSRHLGMEAQNPWDGLNAGTRETFERFGITPEDWESVRHGLEPASDGKTYFTLDHVEQTASPDLRLKFATLVHNVLDDTVSEPRAREKAFMTGGSKAGTVQGEIMRAFWQFKGFTNTILGRHLVPAARGYAGYQPVALIAHFIIGTALAGYISMNAKMIASGQAPRSLLKDDGTPDPAVWTGALAQGGGFGIYGDFLFGEQNRAGAAFDFARFGGPMLSDAEQVAQVVYQSVHGGDVDERTGKSPLPGELVRLGGSNIPLINTFYTRLALDYLVLWRLQEAASPGYLQRYQSRVENQEGRHFIVAPTSAQ